MKITVIDKGIEKVIDAKYLEVGRVTLEQIEAVITKYDKLLNTKQEEVSLLTHKNKILQESIDKYETEIKELRDDIFKLKSYFVKMLQAFLFRGEEND